MSRPGARQAGLAAACARGLRYLARRESPRGGYCFYRSQLIDEPNLFDTYHAVEALARCGARPKHPAALLRFLRRFSFHGQLPGLYHQALLYARFDRRDLVDVAAIRRLRLEVPGSSPRSLSSELWRLCATVELKRRFDSLAAPAGLVAQLESLIRHGGPGHRPNLTDTTRAVQILDTLGALSREAAAAARDRLARFQAAAVGFTLTADSTASSLEVIRLGSRCCRLIGLPVRFQPDIERFVLACQNADGGFGRVPGALPEIESTHHAIAILQGLDVTRAITSRGREPAEVSHHGRT